MVDNIRYSQFVEIVAHIQVLLFQQELILKKNV